MATGDDPTEVARATAYLDSQATRAAVEDARRRMLAGSESARAALGAADVEAPSALGVAAFGDATLGVRTELERAVEYRRSLASRAAAEHTRARMLTGSRIARVALADRWSPFAADRRYPTQAPVPGAPYPAVYPATY